VKSGDGSEEEEGDEADDHDIPDDVMDEWMVSKMSNVCHRMSPGCFPFELFSRTFKKFRQTKMRMAQFMRHS